MYNGFVLLLIFGGDFILNTRAKKLSVAAMFSALAVAFAALANVIPITLVPSLPFLNYDPKDILIAICGFILGPAYVIPVSLISALVEMLTVSSTGLIGMLMNFLSSAIFAGTAALVYYRKRDIGGAIIGLCCSSVLTTAFMLGWNYIVSPYYMGVSREAISAMLIPGFLPFNLIKSVLNSGLILLLYNPLITVLRGIGLVDGGKRKKAVINRTSAVSLLIGCVMIIAAVVAVLIISYC